MTKMSFFRFENYDLIQIINSYALIGKENYLHLQRKKKEKSLNHLLKLYYFDYFNFIIKKNPTRKNSVLKNLFKIFKNHYKNNVNKK